MTKDAGHFYIELLQVVDMSREGELGYTLHECYVELYRVWTESLMTLTEESRMDFSGSFARFTYVVQKGGISKDVVRGINAFRGRAKGAAEKQTYEVFVKDLSVVALFISGAFGEEIVAPLRPLVISPGGEESVRMDGASDAVDYMRVAVDEWDGKYITCLVDGGNGEKVKVCYNTDGNYLGNWGYVGRLLSQGDQLNLIHPKEKDGVIYPELIVYQPDYLMDISAIAACFEPFGATPFNYLLGKFRPSRPSKPQLLGLISGELLDYDLNNEDSAGGYVEVARDFFRKNALAITCCNDDISDFHKEARDQQENIRQILNTAFNEDKFIDREKILLEPSFFCEKLGFQGRMDLLQTDYKVLMEQKSGKRDFNTGGHVQKHYCQMLMYQALLHYGMGLANDEISCFLMYSRYKDGLLKETQAPRLLFEIMRVRNQVVWNEFNCSRGGIRILEGLTIDKVNANKIRDRFTQLYLLDPIEKILRTVQTASMLEREYFYRMFTFVQREHVLAKVGNSVKEASGLSALWNCTLDEKKLAGNILVSSALSYSADEGKGVERVELLMADSDEDYLPNFRKGDAVILYRYKADGVPDARKGLVLRASIEEIKADSVTLSLRAVQKNLVVFRQGEGECWAVEHDFVESSFTGLYRSLFSFFYANKDRRDLILGQREATADDYTILIGPPGTGKTSFGLMKQLNGCLAESGSSSVLLLSYTNRAVDEICSKLVEAGLDFIRIGSRMSCSDEYRPYLLEEKVKECKNSQMVKHMLMSARVVVGTTTSVTSHLELLELRPFTLAIVDEASQILEPHLIGILCAKCGEANSIGRFFLIGDHKQLPAVVQQREDESEVESEMLRRIGLTNCRNSLFERLLRISPAERIERFTRQGRMHRDVALFANENFYAGLLDVVPLPHQESELDFPLHADSGMELLLATRRMAFIDVPRPRRSPSAKVNIPEAEVIADAVMAVYDLYRRNGRKFEAEETVGVIVPYRNQISAVRKEIARRSGNNSDFAGITIDTVERYQGSQRNVIIYGFTVQFDYQLDFLTSNCFVEDGYTIDRKLNVALTRAKEQQLLVGNKELLSKNEVFRKLF